MRKPDCGRLLNLFLFISFCLGIILGSYLPYFLVFVILFFIAFALAFYFYRKGRLLASDISILIIFLFLGALWTLPSSGQKIDQFINRSGTVTLKVISLPREGALRNSFMAKIKEINGLPLGTKVKVMDYTKSMGYLNTYAFKAKLTARSYGGKKFYRLWVKSAARLKEFPLSVWGKLMKKSSLYILDVFKKNCTPEAHRFLSAVFLGRRELLGPEKDFFVNTGLSHLLAISGLHIGLTALILFFMLGFFISSFRARLLISLLFLYFYTFLSGASPSTLRAAIMYSTFALGFFAKRRVDILNSLSLAGFIILLFEPHSLFSIGFQLSFLSVLGIILGFKVFPIKSASNLPLNYLKQIFFCSLFVTLFITPLVSYYFGRIHIFNMFYNIIFIPFFTFILGVNFLLLVFSFFPFVAQSLGAVVSGLISWFNTLIRASSFIKFSFISYTFRLWVIAIYYLFLTGILVYFSALRRSIKSLTR